MTPFLKTFKKSKIAAKLVVYIILFSSFITVISTLIQLYMDYRYDVSQIEQHIEMFETVYLESLTNSLWVYDEKQLNIQLDGLLRVQDVEYIEVRSEQGEVWSAGVRKSKRAIVTDIPIVKNFRQQDYKIGALHVEAGLDSVYRRLIDKCLLILLSNAVKTALVAGFILLLFQYLVTRHLNRIARHFDEIDPGRPDRPIVLDRRPPKNGQPDELDRLVGAINNMQYNTTEHLLARDSAERRLKESHSRLQTIFDGMEEDVYVSDLDTGEIHFVNKHVERSFGPNLVGKKCWEVFRDEDAPCADCRVTEIIGPDGNPTAPVVWEGVNPITGRWRRNQDQAIVWIDGRLVHLHLATDITAEKKAVEDSIRLSSLVEHSTDFIGITGLKGEFLYLNQAGCRLVGLPEPCRAAGARIHDLVGPEIRDYLNETILPMALADGSWTGEIVLHPTEAETPIPVDANIFVIKDPQTGTVSCLAAVMRDITERIQAKQENERLEGQLRQTQKMEAIGTLAGGIAHDFNNILAAIIGYSELALLDLPANNPGVENIGQAIAAGNRAKALVQQILTFSRKLSHEKKAVDLAPILEEALIFLRASLPATVEIRKNIEPDTGIVEADHTQMHQVLMNLCANAGQAMGEAGGVLSVSLCRFAVEDSDQGLPAGDYVKLSVGDTGPGIDPDALDRIFEPFYSTKEAGRGTGMGLAVVHGIVKNHGGAITVDNIPGQGAVFHIFLPSSNHRSGEIAPVEDARHPTGAERILLVDDEPSLTRVGKQLLERLGYTVDAMTDSREALKAFMEAPDKYDLILTDQTMPKMTGAELARAVFELKPGTPVVICSGYSSQIDAEQAKELGARAFLSKPFILKDMAVTIRTVLDERKKDSPQRHRDRGEVIIH